MSKNKIFLKIIVILVINVHNSMVTAQDPDSDLEQAGDLWSPVIAAAPGAILGLVNLALVSKLGSISNRGGIVDGFTRLVPGLSHDGQKKLMLFLGKHNIQVSNHKESEEHEEGYEEDNEEYFGNIHEDLGVDDYGKGKGKRKHKTDKHKNKKMRTGKHKHNDQQYHKHKDHNKYGKQKFKDFSDISDPYSSRPYGNTNEKDYKSNAIKDAMAFQYPDIDQSQIYWPQTDESKTKSFKSLLNVNSKISKRPDLRHKMDGQVEPVLTVSEPTSTAIPSSVPSTTSDINSGYVVDSDSRTSPIKQSTTTGKERPSITTYDFDEYEDSVEYQPNEYQTNDFETELEEAYSSFNKFNQDSNFMYEDRHFGHGFYPRLFRKKRSNGENWTGMVPLQKQVNNSTKTVDFSDISPEMVKLLLSAVNELSDKENGKPIERRDKNVAKKSDKKKGKQKPEVDDEEDEEEDRKKSSSNRITSSRKPSAKKQSIAFIPIEKYQNILNLSENRKQDRRVERRRKNTRGRHRYNEEEEEEEQEAEATEEDNDYYDKEEDNRDEDEGYDEFYDDEQPVEGHSTVQKIEIPDEGKYNYGFGFGSWFKRMFTFRSHPFSRTDRQNR